MNIFLIIIGAILLIICGILFLSTHTTIKNQANWDKFYKSVEEQNLPIPEEAVYKLVYKMNFWFGFGTALGVIILMAGIILQITTK